MALVECGSSYTVDECVCVIRYTIDGQNTRFLVRTSPLVKIATFHADVCEKLPFVSGTFDLMLKSNDEHGLIVSEEEAEGDLLSLGVLPGKKSYFYVEAKDGVAFEMVRPANMRNGNTENLPTNFQIPAPPTLSSPPNSADTEMKPVLQRRMAVSGDEKHGSLQDHLRQKASEILKRPNSPIETVHNPVKQLRFVGLVNQAMTCYLNSLIQTLYMTPEFRNALYRWECDSNDDPSTSIPFQLQHLFLLLQTSNKQSVETTGLTRSFGWDSSEAWQQHDIQELCRVMFDALEKKFEGTDQADLIKRLYEGKMKDYVQCCECKSENAKNDTFLDVPITIRPFGSSTTYKSVMEGLNAFVEPETLDGNNQYSCEKCGKKCDAKKGLKFTKFPYLLTLQLKRFDFDYSTMHRIKLNDCMLFPQILNLNSFINDNKKKGTTDISADDEDDATADDITDDDVIATPPSECQDEDSSSHDSGNDPDHTPDTRGGNSSEEEGGSSVDEGIDIESSGGRKTRLDTASWWLNNEDTEIVNYLKEGPFVYELFSIMVHSGSAAGGHYYAYVKSFTDNRWYSFNDQIVSPITHFDIEKTFGGSPYSRSSAYYSSFSSSTNAYMLMYRQINSKKNKDYMPVEELPGHIQRLVEREEKQERQRRLKIEQERNMCSIQLFCRHPSILKHGNLQIVEESFDFHKDVSLEEAVKEAHSLMKLDYHNIEVDCCRLVKYDHLHEVPDRSFDLGTPDGEKTLSHLLGGVKSAYLFDLLLETREKDEQFEKYEPGGITLKLFVADRSTMSFKSHGFMRSSESTTVVTLKKKLAVKLDMRIERLLVGFDKYSGECALLLHANKTLKLEGFFRSAKLYIDELTDEEHKLFTSPSFVFEETALWSIVDRSNNLVTINVLLPPSETANDELIQQQSKQKKSDIVRSCASSDEGVGSLGGSSGNAGLGSPERVEGQEVISGSPNCPVETDDPGLTSRDINHFWESPELSESRNKMEDEAPARKRNNSYEDSIPEPEPFDNFTNVLQRKLVKETGYESPTSSLNCEDGNSSRSGCGSFITDTDFDDSYQSPPHGAVGSEGSSLSTSCSTLDSTDTLCNPRDTHFNPIFNSSDPAGGCGDSKRAPCESAGPDVAIPQLRGGGGRYPGHPRRAETLDSYGKALRYTDTFTVFPATRHTMAAADGGSPSSGGDAQRNNHSSVKFRSPSDKKAAPAQSDVSMPGYFCAASTCLNCAPAANPLADNIFTPSCSSGHADASVGQADTKQSDPESGEGLDKLEPLFNENESFPRAKIPSECEDIYSARKRTVSASSDGWGLTAEVRQKSFYFKVVGEDQTTCTAELESVEFVPCKVLKIEMDKRMHLLALKKHLVNIVGVPTRRFCVYKQFKSGQETEMSAPSEDFKLVSEGQSYVVRRGRALRKNECRCKLFTLHLEEEETAKVLMDWVVQKEMSIQETLMLLSEDLAEQRGINCPPDRLRLRKKNWRSPSQIYFPEQKFGIDISLYGTLEYFVQFLPGPETKTSPNQLLILCRRWRPSILSFDDFHELLLSDDEQTPASYGFSAQQLLETLSKSSRIPLQQLQIAKGRGVFPFRISVLDVESDLDWQPDDNKSNTYPMHLNDDGIVIFYKDSTEELKELTDEEKLSVQEQESKSDSTSQKHTNVVSSPIRTSYRRERALKIYTVDTAPKANSEVSEL